MADDAHVHAPSWAMRMMELRWPAEAAAYVVARPALRVLGGGDQHPVLVLPGFTAGDASTVPLRLALRGHGYWVHGWRLGRNVGPTERIVSGMRDRLDELHQRHERTVTLVGWSLGGIYARLLARERPGSVRQVITLGSPYRMIEGDRSAVQGTWKRYEHLHVADLGLTRLHEHHRPPLEVPATSIYSRTDGVASWHTCIDETGDRAENLRAENIEVRGTHVGLGVNPAVLFAVLDRLSQPADAWRPFQPPAVLRRWYPTPVSWDRTRARRAAAA
jgi:pimeloyl-ACP methyl ester carboxylesterase